MISGTSSGVTCPLDNPEPCFRYGHLHRAGHLDRRRVILRANDDPAREIEIRQGIALVDRPQHPAGGGIGGQVVCEKDGDRRLHDMGCSFLNASPNQRDVWKPVRAAIPPSRAFWARSCHWAGASGPYQHVVSIRPNPATHSG